MSEQHIKQYRAGRYVSQSGGYRAFIPASLPPQLSMKMGDRLQVLLSQADRALGRLDGSIQTLPNPDLFVLMYVRKEAVLSSQIEGTQSSLQDVLEAESQILRAKQPADVKEVINHVGATNYGIERLSSLPVSVRFIRELHSELMRGARGSHLTPGELRTSQNWIGPAGCTLSDATFIPPPPHELGKHLADWEQFIHADTDLPLLIKVGLAHAQFETIHPFLDGNGRIGRLLITLLLCERQVLCKPVLYLSHYFKRYRQEYYDRLQAIRDHGSWEDWLEFFLTGTIEVSNQAVDSTRSILDLREQHRAAIMGKLGRASGNGHRLLEYLFDHPIVSVIEVSSFTGTTYAAANALVKKLCELEILSEITGQARNRQFQYQDYIRIFSDSGART